MRSFFTLYVTFLLQHILCWNLTLACPKYCQCDTASRETECCLATDLLKADCSLGPGWTEDKAASSVACSQSWNSLILDLKPGSWPPKPGNDFLVYDRSSCTWRTEEVIIKGYGHPSPIDGLRELTAEDFSKLIYSEDKQLSLKNLKIQHTQLHIIEMGFMDRIKALGITEIAIIYNPYLSDLRVGWLTNVNYLQSLDLRGNNISSVDLAGWGIKKNTRFLKILNLSENRISRLSADTFEYTPELEELYLDSNYLTSLDLRVLKPLKQLRVLSLQGNQLNLDSLTGSISKLLPNLEKLDLSTNPLVFNLQRGERLPSWWLSSGCPEKLNKLSLRNSGIGDNNSELIKLDLANCPNLQQVDLNGNYKLTCVPQSLLGLAPDYVIPWKEIKCQFSPRTLVACKQPPVLEEPKQPAVEVKQVRSFPVWLAVDVLGLKLEKSSEETLSVYIVICLFAVPGILTVLLIAIIIGICTRRTRRQSEIKMLPSVTHRVNGSAMHSSTKMPLMTGCVPINTTGIYVLGPPAHELNGSYVSCSMSDRCKSPDSINTELRVDRIADSKDDATRSSQDSGNSSGTIDAAGGRSPGSSLAQPMATATSAFSIHGQNPYHQPSRPDSVAGSIISQGHPSMRASFVTSPHQPILLAPLTTFMPHESDIRTFPSPPPTLVSVPSSHAYQLINRHSLTFSGYGRVCTSPTISECLIPDGTLVLPRAEAPDNHRRSFINNSSSIQDYSHYS
ncbi:hypothetical protein Ciccas_009270 [Cichlidogyrus casuarinus]|uniref:Uncharacterized protein n=1 Tax=Cichlidogyrus casuarinus TaxID=1844966 RepID=A0ABD2PXI2_9PLAT